MTRLANVLKSGLINNILSLSVLQGANYLLPLLTLPYLYRALGVESMGFLAVSIAVMAYFQIITDYGFDYSGTQGISRNKSNKIKVEEIYSSIFSIKVVLLVFCFFVLLLISEFDSIRNYKLIYFLGFGSVIGQVLFPVWFFQGFENMRFITILNLFAKFLYTILIFVLVKNVNDLYFVPLINSLISIGIGLFSIFYIYRTYDISYKPQKFDTLKEYFKDSWRIFSTNIFVSLYTNSTPLIFGFFVDQASVGYFNIADKIVKAVKGLYTPISQSVYPYISNKIHGSVEEGLGIIRKLENFTFLIMGFASILILFLSRNLILFFGGEEYEQSILVLKIMSFLPLIIAMGNVYSVQGLFNIGKASLVNRYVMVIVVVHFVHMFLLTKLFGIIGGTISLCTTEVMVLFFSCTFYYKEKQKTNKI
jgi:PST family polysaccharide transporter